MVYLQFTEASKDINKYRKIYNLLYLLNIYVTDIKTFFIFLIYLCSLNNMNL